MGQKLHGEIVREQEMLPPVAEDQLIAEELSADGKEHGHQVLAKAESKNKQQAWNKDRTQDLGDNPRKTRQALRVEVEQGFCGSFVGKKRIVTLRKFRAQCASSFHCLEEEWKDCEELRPKPEEKWSFVDRRVRE